MAASHMSSESTSVVDRTVLVTGIPYITDDAEQLKDKLELYFGKTKYGGGDVETIISPFSGSFGKALIVFELNNVIDTVLKHKHKLEGQLIDVQRLPPVSTELQGLIDDFYWDALPRNKSEELVVRLTQLLGKDKTKGTKHKLTEVIGIIDQMKEVETCVGEQLGLVSGNSNSDVADVLERSVTIDNIPYVTEDKEQLSEELRVNIRQKCGVDLEFLISPVKGDIARAIAVFKSTEDRDRFLQHGDHTFFKESIHVDKLPQVFKVVTATVEEFYFKQISREKMKKMAALMHHSFGSNLTENGGKLRGTLKQIIEAVHHIVSAFGLIKIEGKIQSTANYASDTSVEGQRPLERNENSETLIKSQSRGLKRPCYDTTQKTSLEGKTSEISTTSKSRKADMAKVAKATKFEKQTKSTDTCTDNLSLNRTSDLQNIQQVCSNINNQAKYDPENRATEHNLKEPVQDNFSHPGGAANYSPNGQQIRDTIKATSDKNADVTMASLSKEESMTGGVKREQESVSPPIRFSNSFVSVDKMVYQFMQVYHKKALTSLEKTYDVKIKDSTSASNQSGEQLLVELKAKRSGANKGKQNTGVLAAQKEFIQLYSDVFRNTKKEVIPFKSVDGKRLKKVQEKIEKKFPDVIVAWKEDNECILCGDETTVATAAEELNDSVSCYECMTVDKITFEYLSKVNKDRLEDIKKKYNFTLEIAEAASKDTNEQAIFIKPNKSRRSKCKIEDLRVAKEQFISLYQKTFFSIKRTPVKCQSISRETFKEAVEGTKKKFQNIIILQEASSDDIIICAEEDDAEHVVKEFRSLAGLLPKRRLMKSKSNDSDQFRQTFESTSKELEHDANEVQSLARNNSETSQSVFVTAEGLKISVITDDITKHKVDVIVNAANSDLILDGGVGGAISLAAGPGLQKECKDILRSYKLTVGECICTNPFNLDCKKVVHAVGPRYKDDISNFEILLTKTFSAVLLKCDDELCARSISIPLISSGTYGGPKQRCAKVLVTALYDFSRKQKNLHLQQVLLVNKDKATTSILQQTCSGKFQAVSQPAKPMRENKQTAIIPTANYKTSNGIEIVVEHGDITQVRVDVIVNAANKHLRHGRGVARAISKAAGPELQEECERMMEQQKPLQTGEYVLTEGFRLQCRVLHTVGPIYDQYSSDKTFFQDLMKTFLAVLRYANIPIEAKDIAIPLISSGIYGGPKQLCADALLNAVEEFNKDPNLVIKTIHLINLDEASTHALQDAFSERYSKGASVDYMPTSVEYEVGLTCVTGRGIKLYVKEDDITIQDVDAVVNPTDGRLQNRHGVAKAISKAAGRKLQERCKAIMTERNGVALKTDQIVETNGYGLKCRHILHITSPIFTESHSRAARRKYCETLVQTFKTCLNCANSKLGVKSIAIPLIGAGISGAPKKTCADALARAIKMFEESENRLRLETVVIISIDKEAIHAVETALYEHFQETTSGRGNGQINIASSNTVNKSAIATLEDAVGPNFNHEGNQKSKDSIPVEQQIADEGRVKNLDKGARPKTALINSPSNQTSACQQQDIDFQTQDVQETTFVSRWLTPVVNYLCPESYPSDCPVSDMPSTSTKKSYSSAVIGSHGDYKQSTVDQPRCNRPKCAIRQNLKRLDGCGHTFCTNCITQYIAPASKCLTCGMLYCVIREKNSQGTMTFFIRNDLDLPGESDKGAIVILYDFPDGKSGVTDVYSSRKYKGGSFKAYVPHTTEGLEVVWMLKTAFLKGYTFKVTLTRSSALALTWSGLIPHKRAIKGGVGAHGFPDPNYLKDVRMKLKKQGIVSSLTGGR